MTPGEAFAPDTGPVFARRGRRALKDQATRDHGSRPLGLPDWRQLTAAYMSSERPGPSAALAAATVVVAATQAGSGLHACPSGSPHFRGPSWPGTARAKSRLIAASDTTSATNAMIAGRSAWACLNEPVCDVATWPPFQPGSAVSLRIPRHHVPDADSDRARVPGSAPRPGASEDVPGEGLTQEPINARRVSACDRHVAAQPSVRTGAGHAS
jgi:hypothetical protein